VPGKPETVAISWVEDIPSDDVDEPAQPDTYHLTMYFFNALARLYTQAYDVAFYRGTSNPATLDVFQTNGSRRCSESIALSGRASCSASVARIRTRVYRCE
jgi:hypothetical protein